MEEHPPNKSTDEIRKELGDREASIDHHLSSLRNEFTNILPQVKNIIEKHPIGSAATVLGVGVVLGYLTSKTQSRGGSTRESLLQSALDPALETVKEHLNQGGHLPGRDVSPILTPAIEAAEKHLIESKSTTTQNTSSLKQNSVISDLVRMLVPIGIQMGLKALDKNDKSDQD